MAKYRRSMTKFNKIVKIVLDNGTKIQLLCNKSNKNFILEYQLPTIYTLLELLNDRYKEITHSRYEIKNNFIK